MRKLCATAVCALVLLAGGADAETLVAPGEFERMSTGKTLYFSQSGAGYGAEQYLPGRQVIWQYADGSCARGSWYEDGEALCFVYEKDPVPHCWVLESRGGDFFARIAGLPPGDPSELRLSGESRAPLSCRAPGLGV